MTMRASAVDLAKRRGPDPTGHVCFNTEESRAFLHSINSSNKMDCLRKMGLLDSKLDRNPLRAEKTPRKDFQYFDPKPPVAIPAKERWKYPETDWGLLLQFDSQKQLYKELEENTRKFEEKYKENRERAKESNTKAVAELKLVQNNPRQKTPVSVPIPQLETISDIGSISTRTDDGKYDFKNITKYGMQTLKDLRYEHPEILDKVRAERAAAFVSKQKHPLAPPTARSLPKDRFKPAGGNVELDVACKNSKERFQAIKLKSSPSKSQNVTTSNTPSDPVDTARLNDQLKVLMDQLDKTENDIAKQQLRISLNRKTHHYESQKKN